MISIVIPYGGDFAHLKMQVSRLYEQDYAGELEIIISCNRGRVAVEDISPGQPGRYTLRVIDASARRGPSYARNVGWRAASGELVLFCDADDEVYPDWVSEMHKSLRVYDAVGGSLHYSRINDSSLASWHSQLQEKPSSKFDHLYFVPSCNLGVRRRVLKELGGFSESLSCGEDIDFCWRAQYAGHVLGFNPAARIDYRLRPTHRALYRQYFAYGQSDALLLQLHKPFGARRSLRATLFDLSAVVKSLMLAPTSRAARLKAIARMANLIGRIWGSAQERVWAV